MSQIRLDYTNVIGESKDSGKLLSIEEIEGISKAIVEAGEEIRDSRFDRKELSFLLLPYSYDGHEGGDFFGDVLKQAMELINQKSKLIREKGSDYIQIAIGGSALGSIVLFNAFGSGLDPRQKSPDCKVHLLDNIDPESIGKVLDSISVERSYFNIISNSGETAETLANFFVFYEILRKRLPPRELRDRIIVTTNPENGTLSELCRQEGLTLLPIPASIHGRFSVLSPAALLTAAVCGIDIESMLCGARTMDKLTDDSPFWQNPMHLYSAIHYLADVQKGLDILVLIPYSDALRTVADWYSQLVAESLGKNSKGITPVKALGATDQHSQLQLYNDGPKNKLVTFFCVESFRRNIEIPNAFPQAEDFAYLCGHSLNELIELEQKATAFSLFDKGVPNCSFVIPEVSPYFIGQLFMLLEKVICVLAKLYRVNAFDQPGVERGKEYARALLGKKGKVYEERREELASSLNPDRRRIA